MFTGIIEATGRLLEVTPTPFGKRFVIDTTGWDVPTELVLPGGSVCVSGVCLTVVENSGCNLVFDVITQTLRCTTLDRWAPGMRLNLEPSLTAGKPLAGHFVQGHVETVGQVLAVAQHADDRRLTLGFSPEQLPQRPQFKEFMKSIVPKGSVAIDGVSLTVAAVPAPQCAFEVALIPTTLRLTTLGDLKVGDQVNLESDVIARTVVHYLHHFAQGESQPETPG